MASEDSIEALEEKYNNEFRLETEPNKPDLFYPFEKKRNNYEKQLMDKLKYNIDDLTVKLEKANMKFYEAEYKAKLAEERKQNYGEVI